MASRGHVRQAGRFQVNMINIRSSKRDQPSDGAYTSVFLLDLVYRLHPPLRVVKVCPLFQNVPRLRKIEDRLKVAQPELPLHLQFPVGGPI